MALFPQVTAIKSTTDLPQSKKQLFFFAHQDDECAAMGLIQRIRPQKIIWLTNGDGLARQNNMSLEDYAAKRKNETLAAMDLLGFSRQNCQFLDFSEEAIYQAFLAKDKKFFMAMFAIVKKVLKKLAPEVIWTCAWQGGHTGHDLVNLLVVMAARQLPEMPLIYELPQYELANLYVVRFSPWQKSRVFEFSLDKSELRRKMQAAYSYESQTALLESLQTYLKIVDRIRRPLAFAQNPLGLEQFAQTPYNRDYTSGPHGHTLLEYTGQRHDGARFYNLLELGGGTWLTYNNTVGMVAGWLKAAGENHG